MSGLLHASPRRREAEAVGRGALGVQAVVLPPPAHKQAVVLGWKGEGGRAGTARSSGGSPMDALALPRRGEEEAQAQARRGRRGASRCCGSLTRKARAGRWMSSGWMPLDVGRRRWGLEMRGGRAPRYEKLDQGSSSSGPFSRAPRQRSRATRSLPPPIAGAIDHRPTPRSPAASRPAAAPALPAGTLFSPRPAARARAREQEAPQR